MHINWTNIRPVGSSQNDGFEELIRQLARQEEIKGKSKFVPLGKPDAGIECFWILDNGDEWGWQAKFFTSSLTATQWRELEESVNTAIDKRPRLTKYIVALPLDPPDARLKGQKSFLSKWDEKVVKWNKRAKERGQILDFEAWWSSDIIARLSRPENAGLTYFFFNKEEFTDEWLKEQTEMSIADLGNRYTPAINVKLELSKIFDGIARDEKFMRQINSVFDKLFIKGKKIKIMDQEVKDPVSELVLKLQELYELFTVCDFSGVDQIPYASIANLLDSLELIVSKLISYFLDAERQHNGKKTEGNSQIYDSELRTLQQFAYSIDEAKAFITDSIANLSNSPILLLDGDAGTGKSHLIADVVRNRNSDGKFSLFLLGQYFISEEDPWTQIFRRLGIQCSVNEFLGALNSKAESNGSRLIIFIDALNEGRGRYFWGSNIRSFTRKIENYKWLGLVLSIRTSYTDLIFPPGEWPAESIVRHTHSGFRDVEYEASRLFFSSYGIEFPSVPLLHPEFQNPLFLKLFCDGLSKSGYSRIPPGIQGITSILEIFLDSVNRRLSKPEKFDYTPSIHVVRKAVDALIQEKINRGLRYIPYEIGYVLVESISTKFTTKKGFLDELISEGVVSKNLFWLAPGKSEEGVYLTYERFEDHITADFLINQAIQAEVSSNSIPSASAGTEQQTLLNHSFAPDGNLFRYVKDEHTCRLNKNLIEAFSIQLPEKTGKELYEYAPHVMDKYPIIESFVQSLLWRKIETITDKSRDYVNNFVFLFQGTYDLFWETILSVTAIPNHYYNANLLHKHLFRFSLADRDASWTIYLKDKYPGDGAVARLIDWAWSEHNKEHIANEPIKLASIALAWFLVSTNRMLRDSATKALICLLENRISTLLELLSEFDDVNDPYVYERLIAVAYGCAVRTRRKDDLRELSKFIYAAIFNQEDDIYPHILLRDYARGVIEYAFYLGIAGSEIDMKRVRPPYKSSFSEELPSNEEIDSKYEFDYKSESFKDYYWGQNDILMSMTTEYGRGTGSYGDFGRYIFQRGLNGWDIDPNSLSKLAIKWIFDKYGYDVEKHGKFDRGIGSGRGRGEYPNERIGKKYQWLAFYEMLARVSDNVPMYADWSHKKGASKPYEGPWDPYVRDIDPTIIIRSTGKNDEETPKKWFGSIYNNWNPTNVDWIKQTDDLPCRQNLIDVIDNDGTEWLVLQGHPEWSEPKELGIEKYDRQHKKLWLQIRSCFVHQRDFAKIRTWATHQSLQGRWMPESHGAYEIFNREHYWSPAYKYFQKEQFDAALWRKVRDPKSGKFVAQVMVTSESYYWEEEFDASKDATLRFLKPCCDLFEKLELSYTSREGEFIDQTGKLICFDPSVYENCESYLLIQKDALITYMQQNDLLILWTIQGEKNIVGDWQHRSSNYVGLQEINGVYVLAGRKVEGTVNSTIM